MPVLVLNGELDQSTPVADARHVANAFPNATLVEVPNTAHVSALYDFQHCASHIVRTFLSTLADGIDGVCRRHAARERGRLPAHAGDRRRRPTAGGPGSQARRAGWVATQTIGDALARWYNLMFTIRGPRAAGRRATRSRAGI